MWRVVSSLAVVRATAFEPGLALKMAYLEKSVYCGEDRFNSWDVGDSIAFGPKVDAGEGGLQLITDDDTECVVGVGRLLDPQGCFLAIHGTGGNWWLDAEFLHTAYSEGACADQSCEVFSGFLKGWESVRSRVFGNLTAMGCDTRPLYLVGHSLGAAMLHFAIVEMLAASLDVRVAYALESPRVGNPVFSDVVQSIVGDRDIWRVAHHKDIVPHVPPRLLPIGLEYKHALREVFFPSHEGVQYSECGLEDSDCSDQYAWWQGDASEHCWYPGIDPCHCTNHTNTPRA